MEGLKRERLALTYSVEQKVQEAVRLGFEMAARFYGETDEVKIYRDYETAQADPDEAA